MGKRRHVRAKSKLKFGKKNSRENRSRSEEEGNCERRKQKRTESVWKRWLAFFRGHWHLQKVKSFRGSTAEAAVHDWNAEWKENSSKPEYTEEADIQFGSPNSTILTNPNSQLHIPSKCAIKTKVTRHEDATHLSLRLSEEADDYFCSSVDDSHCRAARQAESTLGNFRVESRGGNISTSALYVRKNMTPVSESAESEDPPSSTQLVASGNSLETEQQGVDSSLVKIETKNEESAIKSMSEPGWSERRKIFRHQKLQENINDLIDQFMFLEKEDLLESYHVNFTKIFEFQNKLKQERTQLRLESCSSALRLANADNGLLVSEASREVSPEILVNIKPFKEYMSDRFVQIPPLQETPKTKKGKNGLLASVPTDPKTTRKRFPGNQKRKLTFQINQNDKKAKPHERIEINNSTNEKPETQEHFSPDPNLETSRLDTFETSLGEEGSCPGGAFLNASESVVCSVWGVCRTYVNFDGVLSGKTSREYASLEHVLEAFDDQDHNLVFRRNLGQFKRQITCENGSSLSNKSFSSSMPVKIEEETQNQTSEAKKEAQDQKSETKEEAQDQKSEIKEEAQDQTPEAKEEVSIAKENEPEEDQHDQSEDNTPPSPCIEHLFNLTVNFSSLKGIFYQNTFLALLSFETNGKQTTMATKMEICFISSALTYREIFLMVDTNFRLLLTRKECDPPPGDPIIIEKRQNTLGAVESQTNSSTANVSDNTEYETASSSLIHLPEAQKPTSEDSQSSDGDKLFMGPTDCFYLTEFEHSREVHLAPSSTLLPLQPLSNRPLLAPGEETTIEEAFVNEDFQQQSALFFPPDAVHRVLQIVEASACDFLLELTDLDSVPAFFLLNSSEGLSVTHFGKKISSSSSETFTGVPRRGVSEHTHISDPCFHLVANRINDFSDSQEESQVWTTNLAKAEDKAYFQKTRGREEVEPQWPTDMRKDGFKILYDGLFKKSLEEFEDGRVALGFGPHSDLFKDTDERTKSGSSPQPGKLRILSQIHFLKKGDGNELPKKLFKYKSVSSPWERFPRTECHGSEYRLRRLFHVINDDEKTEVSQNAKKKRALLDRGIQIQRPGSGMMRKSGTFLGSISIRESVGPNGKDLVLADPRVEKWERSCNQLVFAPQEKDENGTLHPPDECSATGTESPRRELMAAINAIRDLDRSRQGLGRRTKRMSLVILLSKNK